MKLRRVTDGPLDSGYHVTLNGRVPATTRCTKPHAQPLSWAKTASRAVEKPSFRGNSHTAQGFRGPC